MQYKLIMIMGLFFTPMIFAYDAFSIGVSGVENTLHSATFYKNNYFYGIDFLHFTMNVNLSETDYNGYGYNTNSSDGGISVNVFMLRIGYRTLDRNVNRINTYNQIEGYIILPMVKGKGDVDISEVEDEIEDALTLMGLKVSHAVEYAFNTQLSLTATFGLNWVFWNFTLEEDNSYDTYNNYGNYVYVTETSTQELSANLSYTYTMLALHYKLNF